MMDEKKINHKIINGIPLAASEEAFAKRKRKEFRESMTKINPALKEIFDKLDKDFENKKEGDNHVKGFEQGNA